MLIKKSVFVLVVLLYSGLSFADCVYNGTNYSSGTVLGPYTCDGTQWVLKP